MLRYNYSVFKVWIRWLFRCQRDVGVKIIDAVSKRELEANLRANGFSFREAKKAVSIFANWSKSGALRDVEATPRACCASGRMPVTVYYLHLTA